MLTGITNRMWNDMTSESNRDSTGKQDRDGGLKDECLAHERYGTEGHPGRRRGHEPTVLAVSGDPQTRKFKPEQILKTVAEHLRNARIREHNALAKVNGLQARLVEATAMYQESDKKNIKVERELDRLKRMLRKGETKK